MTDNLIPDLRLDAALHADQPLLDVRNAGVTFWTEHGDVQAVRDISLQLYRGETVAVVGESGSGKSVTARLIMGLLSKRARVSPGARVLLDGQDILKYSGEKRRQLRGSRISMIFQEPMSSLNPLYTVGNQIVEAIRAHRRVSRAEARRHAVALLDEVRIPNPELRIDQYPHQLSGGQRQRVMIAMALANNPDVLIADEPTTALDVTVQAQILNLLRDLQKKARHGGDPDHPRSHRRAQVLRLCLCDAKGALQEHNTTAALFEAPRHPYTRHLLGSEPRGTAKPLGDSEPIILEGRNVRVAFALRGGGFFRPTYHDLVAVDGLSLRLRRHETLGLVGESGSGKTTFGQALARLIDQDGGEILFDNVPIHDKNREEMRPLRSRMQIVFQDPFSSLNPRMTVGQIIGEGLVVNGIGANSADRQDRVRASLRDAGLPDNITGRFPHEFSGGQRQRIAIARAIALEPEFLLLDEPTSALDLSVQAQIIDLLRKLQDERGLSYLFISHDLKVVRALCHRVIVMQHGKIVEQGPVGDILSRPQTEYTQKLVKAAFDVAD